MNQADKDRYARQIRLSQIGETGQQAIIDASALIVGVGGLGSPAAMYLAAAGIGKLVLSDYDIVETSNLQRQIIHADTSVGDDKVASGKRTLNALNPNCEVETLGYQLERDELTARVKSVDIVLDCTDNYPTRFDINRACVETATPLVTGAAIRLEGQLGVFENSGRGPCYRCLYDDEDEWLGNCQGNGVLAPVPGVIGTLMAVEALKLLAGVPTELLHRMLLWDAKSGDWQRISLGKRAGCPDCQSVD